MELKTYQKQAIDDLTRYLELLRQHQGNYAQAFVHFWANHPYFQMSEAYRDTLPNVPHICLKVPTAGGKTYIACNAIKPLFEGLDIEQNRLVVWLVPSQSILEQTKNNLKNPKHFYRKRLNDMFGRKVEVYDVEELLEARSFSPRSVQENVSILVLSYQTIRFDLKKLEGIDGLDKASRRIYKASGRLMGFFENETDKSYQHPAKGVEEKSLINAIRKYKPVCIIDEAHNATSDLSIEMLDNLNPCFVLELTATPREVKTKGNKKLDTPVYLSNIITYIDSYPLKQENMVKLPMLVYNGKDKKDVIRRAMALQDELEMRAKQSPDYIRPIVLFQAESVSQKEERETYQKIKEELIKNYEIPEEQIAIKTANINEIKNVNLLSKDCKIRYIITIDALKEGWDCPFAYILASVAERKSKVSIQQLVGRVLRKPYTKEQAGKHLSMLNMSYVLTNSTKFSEVLDQIVDALNGQGFSEKDLTPLPAPAQTAENDLFNSPTPTDMNPNENPENLPAKTEGKPYTTEDEETTSAQFDLEDIAHIYEKDQEKTNQEKEAEQVGKRHTPEDVVRKVNLQEMKSEFQAQAQAIRLPKFVLSLPASLQQKTNIEPPLLSYENLLEGFELRYQSMDIDFDKIALDLYEVDVEGNAQVSRFVKAKATDTMQKLYLEAFAEMSDEAQKKTLCATLLQKLGKIPPFEERDLRDYVKRVIDSRHHDEIQDLNLKQRDTAEKIKIHIKALGKAHARKSFFDGLASNRISVAPLYRLPLQTNSNETTRIAKSLYHKVEGLNGLEERFIAEVASYENVVFWHKFGTRHAIDFYLNAEFVNHFPDFLIYTKLGNVLLVETKGNQLLNEETETKRVIGKEWASMAGLQYKYFLVSESIQKEGFYSLDSVKNIIKKL